MRKTNKRWISALTAGAMLLTYASSFSASAFTKDDIYAIDEHSVTFWYTGADYDMMVVADTAENNMYLRTEETDSYAVVMENADTEIDAEKLAEISEKLTAVPAAESEYSGFRSSTEYGGFNLGDLDLSRTYVVSGDPEFDGSGLYDLDGVTDVYELTATFTNKGWIVGLDNGLYWLWVSVPAGTEFTLDDCASLPYTVQSITYKQTYNGYDNYDVAVEYDPDDERYEDPRYKSIFDMQIAMLDLFDGNIDVTTPLIHNMSVSTTKGNCLLTRVQETTPESICDIDGNGTVEIADATAILQSYANTAAGITTASAENPMDVNGDGAVGIDDATFVLTVYAELAAGMR